MAVAHRSATGRDLNPTTLKVRTVSLPYLYVKGSGMICLAVTNGDFSAKGVSWCGSNLCKTFIACFLSPTIVTLAAIKYSSTASPANTQDATTAVATFSSSSNQSIITYHFSVTNGPSTTQRFTSGLTTVSLFTVTATTAASATTTLATPVETSIQPDTTSSATLDLGDIHIIKILSPLILFSINSHFDILISSSLCCLS